jgi:predicted ATP-grasp superfamily ATP-dependent carboligase
MVPSALDDPEGFVDALEPVVHSEGVDLLLPITDASLLAVLGARARFSPVNIPFVSIDQFRRVSEKATVLEVARSIGIAVPDQHVLATSASVATLDREQLRYPIVLKPTRSVVERGRNRLKLGVLHASDAAELSDRLAEYPAEAFPVLLQQRIVGPGIGVFLLIWDGQLVASFGHRRIRENPPFGGVSAYRESIVPSELLVSQSRRLLAEFDWRGVAMVEFKVDLATGVPYLMEVNGRFWGSLQLAIDAGVDFPMLLARAALDGDITPAAGGRAGIRSRWEWGDANHVLARLRKSATELALPPGSPTRLRTIGDVLTWQRGDRLEVFRMSDLAPFLLETIDWFRRR